MNDEFERDFSVEVDVDAAVVETELNVDCRELTRERKAVNSSILDLISNSDFVGSRIDNSVKLNERR
ncbi:hypothetical protein WICPIJ_004212 [Wickerhamomyces pijperi]|uniref:Uncharacterized protein n=1 Tax=Wickerhamomyces pijperi TaxID=599730 RepID=A0A9P8Q6D7_WICPI|nr:hypothetical protein WICPIJ_004212 [Wickerhamomyces pijperi]